MANCVSSVTTASVSQHMPCIVIRQVLAVQATHEQQKSEDSRALLCSCDSVRAHQCKYLRWFALPANAARSAFLWVIASAPYSPVPD